MDAFSFRNQVTRDCEWFARSFTGPQDVMPKGYPAVTFLLFKRKESAGLSEYCTPVRVVVDFDQLRSGDLY